jgi:hypothetical protein
MTGSTQIAIDLLDRVISKNLAGPDPYTGLSRQRLATSPPEKVLVRVLAIGGGMGDDGLDP